MPNSPIDEETIAAQLVAIRAALRTRMDGSVAQSMRERDWTTATTGAGHEAIS